MNIHVMSEDVKARIIQTLTHLRDVGPIQVRLGICFNGRYLTVDRQDINFYGFITENSKGWKHCSGCENYPVVDNCDYGKWEGPNLEMRLSLIDYLINSLK